MNNRWIVLLIILVALVGCGNQKQEDNSENQHEDNGVVEQSSVQFQNIDVTVENNIATMTGQAISSNGEFFYVVLIGEKEVSEETKVSIKDGIDSWSDFSIELELTEEMLEAEEDVPVFQLYGKRENGDRINPNYIPIDVHMY
ncbi:hypothetical protein GMD78_17365 [Ornithinibacillus sp. L9]|uniref:Lipoprotein n=1 Tax=Ornithinibacillus caprae TaxID=2678566 RepID=A0A6N8FL09_9BACI|nr:hypothetical protein [Ornithinibacillus caprae]MUK90145.1 hypothetical protein [Ornithinibacillus caprae]